MQMRRASSETAPLTPWGTRRYRGPMAIICYLFLRRERTRASSVMGTKSPGLRHVGGGCSRGARGEPGGFYAVAGNAGPVAAERDSAAGGARNIGEWSGGERRDKRFSSGAKAQPCGGFYIGPRSDPQGRQAFFRG